MKKISNIYKTGLLIIVMSIGMYGCEDFMDKVNEDTNHTKDAPAKFTIADVITSTAFYNVWNNLYSSLKNARMVKERCSEGGPQEGNSVTRGIAGVLVALNSAIITDMFGDVPFSEAAQPTMLPAIFNPKIDKQEDIYKTIHNDLDEAISDLQGTDAHITGGVGSYDLLYGGDKTLWTKFAYGLKARYTMRLLHRSTDKQGDLQKVIDYVEQSFASADEQAAFNVYDAANLNPLFDFQWSRDGLAASKSLFDRLAERDDPRLRRAFVNAGWSQITGSDDESLMLAPNGGNSEVQYYYNTSVFVFSQTAATQLLSYHELQFLKAEALCRLDKTEEAKPVLKEAFVSAVANLEASVEAALAALNERIGQG